MSVFIKKFADVAKFALWADGAAEGKKARFILGFRDGAPRFTVYTGVSGKDGVISFPSDIATCVYFLTVLKEMATAEPGSKQSIDSLTVQYENDQPTKNKRVVSTIYVGKSAEGIVYVAIFSENRPKLVFEIKPSDFHIFKDKENSKISDAVISAKMAKGLADFMLNVIANVITTYTVEELESNPNEAATIKSSSYNKPSGAVGAATANNIEILDGIPY